MNMKYSDLDPRLAAAVKTAKEPNTPAPVIPFVRQRVEPAGDELETVKASDYKMRGIRWLWPSRFAIGKLWLI